MLTEFLSSRWWKKIELIKSVSRDIYRSVFISRPTFEVGLCCFLLPTKNLSLTLNNLYLKGIFEVQIPFLYLTHQVSCDINWKIPYRLKELFRLHIKGQLISKADLRAIDSPKKRTDEFVLFAFFTLLSKQIKFVHMFFGRICGAPICFSVLSELYWCQYPIFSKNQNSTKQLDLFY